VNSLSDNAPVCLIGFAESLPTPEVCFSLRTAGVLIKSFYRLEKGVKFARLNFVQYLPVASPEVDFSRTVSDVEHLIGQIQPELTVPCDDAALMVLSCLRDGPGNCLAPSGVACEFAVDKWAQIEAASASGFRVMNTKLVTKEDDVARFPFRPAILKPRAALDRCGSGLDKGRAFIINSDHMPEKAREALARRPYLIQEYKAGVGEGYFGIAHAGKVLASFGHRRVRMMNPMGSGASACVSREPDAEEAKAAEALVKRTEWQGPFMVELLRDNFGKTWFMEFNGRFWGSLALARRCGLDMPRIALDLARGKDIVVPPHVDHTFARHLGRDFIHLLFVLLGRNPALRPYTWSERLSTVRTIISPNRLRSFYNYDPSQPLFFVKDAVITVLNAILGNRT
jgi:hypothetical protein